MRRSQWPPTGNSVYDWHWKIKERVLHSNEFNKYSTDSSRTRFPFKHDSTLNTTIKKKYKILVPNAFKSPAQLPNCNTSPSFPYQTKIWNIYQFLSWYIAAIILPRLSANKRSKSPDLNRKAAAIRAAIFHLSGRKEPARVVHVIRRFHVLRNYYEYSWFLFKLFLFSFWDPPNQQRKSVMPCSFRMRKGKEKR